MYFSYHEMERITIAAAWTSSWYTSDAVTTLSFSSTCGERFVRFDTFLATWVEAYRRKCYNILKSLLKRNDIVGESLYMQLAYWYKKLTQMSWDT